MLEVISPTRNSKLPDRTVQSMDPPELMFGYTAHAMMIPPFAPKSVLILGWGEVKKDELVYYTYAKQIDAVADLLARQENLVVLSAVNWLSMQTTVPRTQDPGRYTDRTVQPGQGHRDAQNFGGLFYLEVRAEAGQLAVERGMLPMTDATRRARRWRW